MYNRLGNNHQWRALAKLSKWLGPIGRKGGRYQHSSCGASAFPRAPTWRPGLEPWGRLPADPVTCSDVRFLFITLFLQSVHVHESTYLYTHTHTHTHTHTQTGLVLLAVTLGSYFSHCYYKRTCSQRRIYREPVTWELHMHEELPTKYSFIYTMCV